MMNQLAATAMVAVSLVLPVGAACAATESATESAAPGTAPAPAASEPAAATVPTVAPDAAAVPAIGSVSSYSELRAAGLGTSLDLPDAFYIEYEVADDDGSVWTAACARDGAGNVYVRTADGEGLYLVDGPYYRAYARTGEDRPFEVATPARCSQVLVGQALDQVLELAEQARMRFMPGMARVESAEVMGRACTVYGAQTGIAGFGVVCTLVVDDETGACLSWEKAIVSGDKVLPSNDRSFDCIAFVTDGVPVLDELL